MALNLFQVLPNTFIQETLATRTIYENLDSLYELDNEVRIALLDLLRLSKLKLSYGIVYAFGWNYNSQLGTGNTSNKEIPTPIDFSTIIDREGRRKNVIQVSAGEDHSLILCEDGTVYSFGWNGYGQLGTGNTDSATTPTEIDTTNIGEKRVIQVQVFARGHHSLILCKDGTVYSFGWNEFGQLGTGNTDRVAIPTPINTTNIGEKRVIQVSVGGYYSLLLCEDGTVYAFGYNSFGELGIGNTDNVSIPTEIDTSNIGEKRVIQVSAGGSHSLILCEGGSVYSFGSSVYGKLGNGTNNNTNNVAIPTPIDTTNIGNKRVVQVSAGNFHSLILCEDGSVYSFGVGRFGQLGTGNTNNLAIPTPIDTSNMGGKRVIQVSAGGSHSLILCEDGTIYSFGDGYRGQLGIGNTDSVAIPTAINTSLMDGQKVICVSSGYRHSLILT